ncbi:MAG: magnesium and cobalt exporter, family, partial [Mycobacterium sp.]|nr:magnesium and cobalt exporter, family [Mycobacterium sp.]
EISANSAATKKALAASSNTVSRTPSRSLIGGLVLHELGHIPVEGESVTLTEFEPETALDHPVRWLASVERMDGRRIDLIKLVRLGPDEEEADG